MRNFLSAGIVKGIVIVRFPSWTSPSRRLRHMDLSIVRVSHSDACSRRGSKSGLPFFVCKAIIASNSLFVRLAPFLYQVPKGILLGRARRSAAPSPFSEKESRRHIQIVFTAVSGGTVFHFRLEAFSVGADSGNFFQFFEVIDLCLGVFQILRGVMRGEDQVVALCDVVLSCAMIASACAVPATMEWQSWPSIWV